MTKNIKQQIQYIISNLDASFQSRMMASKKEEELIEKKYDISDRIYCLYANEEQNENKNHDFRESLDWLVEQFYQSKENVSFWDKNWTFDENSAVYAKRFGKFYISKSGQFKLVSPEDFISSTDNSNQHKYIDLRIKRFEISNNSWFYFRGNKYLGISFLTRLYFNFNYDFENIVSFSKDLCDTLNAWAIPFEYKFATQSTKRFDKGVLYTAHENYYIVFYIVKTIVSDFKYVNLFGEENLAFTKTTNLKGISFGEEPPIKNSSFGRYRADILADIYIDYYKSRKKCSTSSRLERFFNTKLLEAGFDKKDFFRNPQSHYPYDFSIFKKKVKYKENKTNIPADKYLIWALNTGRLICKHAIIINQQGKTNCLWLSIIEDEVQNMEYRLTDDSFHEGRLGIVFFLAKLYSYFPDEYIFKIICKAVLKNISLEKNAEENSHSWDVINKINIYLKSSVSKVSKKQQGPASNLPFVNEIDKIISEMNSYSTISTDAPQPIINKGHSAIGLILLAMHENNADELKRLAKYYEKDSLLKLINYIKF